MDQLSIVVDVIILAGAFFLAVERICKGVGKPLKFFKNKTETSFEERVKAILDEVLPEKLKAHDLETRDRYRADREKYLQDIKEEVLKSIQQELGQVGQLTKQYEALVISAKDVLREKIMAIYFKNRKDRTMTFHEKEALDQYYKDYKAINGNSYIDKYYRRMSHWTIIDDDYEEADPV